MNIGGDSIESYGVIATPVSETTIKCGGTLHVSSEIDAKVEWNLCEHTHGLH